MTELGAAGFFLHPAHPAGSGLSSQADQSRLQTKVETAANIKFVSHTVHDCFHLELLQTRFASR